MVENELVRQVKDISKALRKDVSMSGRYVKAANDLYLADRGFRERVVRARQRLLWNRETKVVTN